jgi:hypothetical protein
MYLVIHRIQPDGGVEGLSMIERYTNQMSDLDRQIAQVGRDKACAISAEDYEQAAVLRDKENRLLAERASRHQEWAAAHPSLPSLAEGFGLLGDEVERIRALLRQQGDGPAAPSTPAPSRRQRPAGSVPG